MSEQDNHKQGNSLASDNTEPADRLRSKALEVRSRIDDASKPSGPLTLLFGIHTSSS
jgi:hypothetical protein